MRVFVYFNLHKKLWSVKSMKTKLVIGHFREIALSGCHYKVSAKGRARVLREKRKNVHAGVVGHIIELPVSKNKKLIEVTYNPYRYETFVAKKSLAKVEYSDFAYMYAPENGPAKVLAEKVYTGVPNKFLED